MRSYDEIIGDVIDQAEWMIERNGYDWERETFEEAADKVVTDEEVRKYLVEQKMEDFARYAMRHCA